MKKNYSLLLYYLGFLSFLVLIPIIIIVFSYIGVTNSKHTALSVSDFINRAELLNTEVRDFKYNNENIIKGMEANNKSLNLKFIECKNFQTADSVLKSEYNNKNEADRNRYEGKNYEVIEQINYDSSKHAYIRIDNTYLEISSNDNEVFENALNTLGYKGLVPRSVLILWKISEWIIYALIYLYCAIPFALIFEKANVQPAYAYIPILGWYFLCKIADKNGWKIIFLFIPYLNIVYLLVLSLKLAKVFNRSILYGIGIFILPIVFIPMVAFDESKYLKED